MKITALGLLTALCALVLGLDAEAQLFRRPQPLQNNNSKVRIIGRNNVVTVQQSNGHNGGALASAGLQRLQTSPAHAYTNQQLLVNPAHRGSLNVVNTFTTPVNTAANIRYRYHDTQAIIVTPPPTHAVTHALTQAITNPCPVPVVPTATASTVNYIQTTQPAAIMQQLQQAYVTTQPAPVQAATVVVPPQVQQEVVTVPAPAPVPAPITVIQPQVQYQEVQQTYAVPQPQVVHQEVQYVQQPQRVVQREVSYQQQQHVEFVQTQHAHYECAPQNVVSQRRQFMQHCAPKASHYRRRG